MKSSTRQLILSSLFIALGILVPILFHMVGLGAFMLPMFWPLCLGAFFLNPLFAGLIGVLTPLLSMLFTGMPPAPVSYLMAPELAAACVLISLLQKKFNRGSFWILFLSLLISRAVMFIITELFAPLIGLPGQAAGIYRILEGLPGLVTLLILIPYIQHRIKKQPVFRMR